MHPNSHIPLLAWETLSAMSQPSKSTCKHEIEEKIDLFFLFLLGYRYYNNTHKKDYISFLKCQNVFCVFTEAFVDSEDKSNSLIC